MPPVKETSTKQRQNIGENPAKTFPTTCNLPIAYEKTYEKRSSQRNLCTDSVIRREIFRFSTVCFSIYRHRCHDDLTSCPTIRFTDLHVACCVSHHNLMMISTSTSISIQNYHRKRKLGLEMGMGTGIVKSDDERVVENSVCMCRDFRKYSSAHSLAPCILKYWIRDTQ